VNFLLFLPTITHLVSFVSSTGTDIVKNQWICTLSFSGGIFLTKGLSWIPLQALLLLPWLFFAGTPREHNAHGSVLIVIPKFGMLPVLGCGTFTTRELKPKVFSFFPFVL
jgi:hypothetical protein